MPADHAPPEPRPGWNAGGLPTLTPPGPPALPPLRWVDSTDAAPGVAPWSSPYRLPASLPPDPQAEIVPPAPAALPMAPATDSAVPEPAVPAAAPPQPLRAAPGPVRRRVRRAGFGLLILAVPAAVAAFVLRPVRTARQPTVTAVFTAPILVLRAAVAGRVLAVNTTQGASVQPDSVLLTIHVEQQPDPVAEALRSRLQAARARVDGFDAQIAAPSPPAARPGAAEMAQARLADLRRLRAAAAAERDQLDQAVTALPPGAPADLVVRSRVRGYVRTLEAVAGTDTVAGATVAQLIDCDRAFLAPQDGGGLLRAGEHVHLQMAGVPAFDGLVRTASGVGEPPGSLVIEPGSLAAAARMCPLGGLAAVAPFEQEEAP